MILDFLLCIFFLFFHRLGASADLDLCLRIKSDFCNNEDVMVVAGDMMFQDQKFDLRFTKRNKGCLTNKQTIFN